MEVNADFARDINRLLNEGLDQVTYTQTSLGAVLNVTQPQVSKYKRVKTSTVSDAVVEKLAQLCGTNFLRYARYGALVTDSDSASAETLNGVYAFDFPDGVIYIGVPISRGLENACMIPTSDIAGETLKSRDSLTNALRDAYTKQRREQALSKVDEFSELEARAKIYLGKN